MTPCAWLAGVPGAAPGVERLKHRRALREEGFAIGWLGNEAGRVAQERFDVLAHDGAVFRVAEPRELAAHPQQGPDDARFVRSVPPYLSEGQINEIGEIAGRYVQPYGAVRVRHGLRAVLPE